MTPTQKPKSEKEAYIAFSAFPQIGPARFGLLRKYFGSAKKAWRARDEDLRKLGMSQKLISDFIEFREKFDLEGYLRLLSKLGIKAITLEDKSYPERLRSIDDAPFLLYIKDSASTGGGDTTSIVSLKEMVEVAIAVVGTRKPSAYGREITERLVTGLVDAGVTIVSGLALGIDAVAHQTALSANGSTIGVLGGGLNKIYPQANSTLASKMLTSRRGLLVSEYPLDYPARPENFPTRNRIVSGLCLGVVVIEGAQKSGTLLTASSAANQGREVFAVPGPITSPMSKAPNFLLKNGAKLVEKVEDILEELEINSKFQITNAKKILPETKEEKRIISTLTGQSMDIDSIIRETNLTSGEVLATLTRMELKGMVKNIGGVYILSDS